MPSLAEVVAATMAVTCVLSQCGAPAERDDGAAGAAPAVERAVERASPRVADLDLPWPDLAVSEWPRAADGEFATEPRPAAMRDLLRPGWVKVLVVEHYACEPCKRIVTSLSRSGPGDADLIVLGVREPDDPPEVNLVTMEALRGGRGWLATFDRGVDELWSRLRTLVPALPAVTPTVIVVDRHDRVRQVWSAAPGTPTAVAIAWIHRAVADVYASDHQPMASIDARPLTRPEPISVTRLPVAAAPPAPPAPPPPPPPVKVATAPPAAGPNRQRDDHQREPARRDHRQRKPARRDHRQREPARRDDRQREPARRDDRQREPARRDDRQREPARRDDRGRAGKQRPDRRTPVASPEPAPVRTPTPLHRGFDEFELLR